MCAFFGRMDNTMKLEIETYGADVLRRAAKPVAQITDEIRALAKDMIETMHEADGVGLAAEQVGHEEAICVIDIPKGADKNKDAEKFNEGIAMPLVLINPRITAQEGSQRGSEGCLSFPEIHGQITRAMQVTVEYTDLDGKGQAVTARGLLARAIQHELDHLAGTLMIDKFSQLQKMAVNGKLRRLAAAK